MIKKALKDEFVKNNIILFSGSMVVAVLNYIYHPVLSRMMSVENFGEVQALISIFLQSGVILGVFGTIVTNITTNHQEEKLSVINQLYKIALISSLILTLAIFLFTPFLKNFLQFHSVASFWALAISLPLSIDLTFRRFYLQGKKRFKEISVVGILFAGGRLFFAITLVWLGWKTFGAIVSLTLTTITSLIYLYWKTHREFKLSLKEKIVFNSELKEEFKYAGLILAVTGFITFLYTADMIFVKHYFSPEQAGFYGGIATIARIIFFVTGSVTGVLIASVKIKNTFRENALVLKKGLMIISLIGLSATSIFFFFPNLVIKLMIGARYLPEAFLLPRMAVVLFLTSVINMVLMYFLALRKYFIIKLVVIIITLITLLTIFHHQEMADIVNNFLVGTIIMISILAVRVYQMRKGK